MKLLLTLTLTLITLTLALFVAPGSALAGVGDYSAEPFELPEYLLIEPVSSQTKFFTCEEKEEIAQNMFAVALDGKKLSPTTSTPEWALRMIQLANEYVGMTIPIKVEEAQVWVVPVDVGQRRERGERLPVSFLSAREVTRQGRCVIDEIELTIAG